LGDFKVLSIALTRAETPGGGAEQVKKGSRSMKKEFNLAKSTGVISLLLLAGVSVFCALYFLFPANWTTADNLAPLVLCFLLIPAAIAGAALGIVSLVSRIKKSAENLAGQSDEVCSEEISESHLLAVTEENTKPPPGLKAGIISLVFGSIAAVYPIIMQVYHFYMINAYDFCGLAYSFAMMFALLILLCIVIPSLLIAVFAGVRSRRKISKGRPGRVYANAGIILAITTVVIIVAQVLAGSF